jgi:hypothetical protein
LGKKKNKKPRRIKYTSLDEYLNSESALVQAALLLDVAAHAAVESKSPEDMAGIARGWMELGAVLHNISTGEVEEEFEGEEGELHAETRIMGFGSPEAREVAEDGYTNKS